MDFAHTKFKPLVKLHLALISPNIKLLNVRCNSYNFEFFGLVFDLFQICFRPFRPFRPSPNISAFLSHISILQKKAERKDLSTKRRMIKKYLIIIFLTSTFIVNYHRENLNKKKEKEKCFYIKTDINQTSLSLFN